MNTFERIPRNEGDLGGDSIESREQPGEYVYYRVPGKQRGEQLIPLNALKDSHPEVYRAAAAKYQGREHTMEEPIPKIDAQWSDVLHLTAVHPRVVKEALIEAGAIPPQLEWYRIPKAFLNAGQTVVYKGESPSGHITDEEILPYDEAELRAYAILPDRTKQYYKDEITAGKQPLLFHGVPHILYRGTINTAELEKISW